MFAAALRSLTFQEREAISDEIHGVGNSVVEETVERVLEALKSLRENYLSNRQHSVTTGATTTNNSPNASRQDQHTLSAKREAYDRAVFLRPMLENDDKLHLMFLRAQRFNPRLAAQHMFLYFEHKRALFGVELLTQKITLKDLTDHEVRLVREGATQLFAGRERTGRGVAYCRIGQWDLSSPMALIRSIWYILSAIEDDEDMNSLDLQYHACLRSNKAEKRSKKKLHTKKRRIIFTRETEPKPKRPIAASHENQKGKTTAYRHINKRVEESQTVTTQQTSSTATHHKATTHCCSPKACYWRLDHPREALSLHYLLY